MEGKKISLCLYSIQITAMVANIIIQKNAMSVLKKHALAEIEAKHKKNQIKKIK